LGVVTPGDVEDVDLPHWSIAREEFLTPRALS
jgi:hypothetical protein